MNQDPLIGQSLLHYKILSKLGAGGMGVAGFRDSVWARRDPDLTLLHGEPEFNQLYPEKTTSSLQSGAH